MKWALLDNKKELSNMNRRDFLKLSGVASLELMALSLPLVGKPMKTEVQAGASSKTIYRGTADGKIMVSNDNGLTWKVQANFGSQISIRGLYTDQKGEIFARLAYGSSEFDLTLAQNRMAWLTVV